MPPLVLRQWHAPRVPFFIVGIFYHIRHATPVLPVVQKQLRAYAQRSGHRGYGLPSPRIPNSATIVPNAVVGTQPQDLIDHIKPIDKLTFGRDRFIVFLLTPKFAQWAVDDHPFLRQAMHQLCSDLLTLTSYIKIHAVTAVVDKLPTPQAINNIKPLGKGQVLDRLGSPPVSDSGLEGLAYATFQASEWIESSRPISPDRKRAIGFIISQNAEESIIHRNLLELPLANTVFQTGSPTTMTFSTWEKKEDSQEFIPQYKASFANPLINLHDFNGQDQCSALAIPLVPLTMPRKVEASMGNILRRVIGPDQKSVTASEELEKKVPEYFKAREEPSQPISVWALLIPKDMLESAKSGTERLLTQSERGLDARDGCDPELWNALWARRPPPWNALVTYALANGARLHRVLSGGGGWGKKAGLLSLHPGVMHDNTSSELVQNIPGEADEHLNLDSALQRVVQPGDSIQFFVSPPSSSRAIDRTQSEVEGLRRLQASNARWNWELGTVPSTIDTLQTAPGEDNRPESKNVFVFRNSFGFLTEGEMTIERESTELVHNRFTTGRGSVVDVPFSRYSQSNIKPSNEPGVDIRSDSSAIEFAPMIVRKYVSSTSIPERSEFRQMEPISVDAKRDLVTSFRKYTVSVVESRYCREQLGKTQNTVARIQRKLYRILRVIKQRNSTYMRGRRDNLTMRLSHLSGAVQRRQSELKKSMTERQEQYRNIDTHQVMMRNPIGETPLIRRTFSQNAAHYRHGSRELRVRTSAEGSESESVPSSNSTRETLKMELDGAKQTTPGMMSEPRIRKFQAGAPHERWVRIRAIRGKEKNSKRAAKKQLLGQVDSWLGSS